jgi:muramoyltetrapeptide carboxypeptidase
MHRRTLIKALAAAPLLAAVTGQALEAEAVKPKAKIQKPKRLQPGMTVGLVSPASNVQEDETTQFAGDLIRSLGFKVKEGKNLYQRDQYLAGTDRQRAADINSMFADKSVDAIFCLRGGYGTPRILPLLDYKAIESNPKVLLGYSDITALLNAIYQRTGLVTFHGPIVADNFSGYTLNEFQKVLVQAKTPVSLGSPPAFEIGPGRVERENRITRFRGGKAQGRLIGGNLSLLCKLLGTPFEPDFQSKILFLEDVGEAPYRIDGMLTHLWLAGKLDQVAGIVFGKFTETDTEENTFSVEQVLRDRCASLKVPVIRGLMIGHVDDQTVLPIGCTAELDGDKGSLTLLESPLI